MRRKRLKKTENLFLWMCLRILLGNHQRVCISKLLKSLSPNVHARVVLRLVPSCSRHFKASFYCKAWSRLLVAAFLGLSTRLSLSLGTQSEQYRRTEFRCSCNKPSDFFFEYVQPAWYCYVHYLSLLHFRPLGFQCVGGCWDWVQDCCRIWIGSQSC